MSKHHLRNDPFCQNCGERVEKRFCGNCGQENTETRQSFGHLVRHFAEDLTHYDGNFWRTIRFLVFRPAFLTKEFLKGKRVAYVPPVRLYIFISFITFLLPYLVPDSRETKSDLELKEQELRDTVKHDPQHIEFDMVNRIITVPRIYTSVRQMDSLQALPGAKHMGYLSYFFNKRYIEMRKYSGEQLGERFFESFGHNMPKVLIIYLPLFAFVLWLFHDKRRWMYFDHGIFTLHYFSFLLLILNVIYLSDVFQFMDDNFFDTISDIFVSVVFLGIIIYFFVAHRRMYESKGGVLAFLNSILIYVINLGIFCSMLILFAFISLFTIH